KFLFFSSLLSLSPYLKAKELENTPASFAKFKPIIAAVQEHMFPEGSKIPSAKSMNVSVFLFETISHKTYDKDIRAFVWAGAKELAEREKNFLSLSPTEKEKALRAYEETGYGSNWLSRIMTVTMEGLFSDPIYGSNVKEGGWKSLNAYGGFPRPQRRYIDV
ncbi:MAG: gluconate 2-dehydrogenase subunit 3 family protein, partial [Epsilonproteobacteria bacterium]